MTRLVLFALCIACALVAADVPLVEAPVQCAFTYRGHCWNVTAGVEVWQPYPLSCGSWSIGSIHSLTEMTLFWTFAQPYFSGSPTVETWTGMVNVAGGFGAPQGGPGLNLPHPYMDGSKVDWTPVTFAVDDGVAPTVERMLDPTYWNDRPYYGNGETRHIMCRSTLRRVALIVAAACYDPGTCSPNPLPGAESVLVDRLTANGWSFYYTVENNLTLIGHTEFDAMFVTSHVTGTAGLATYAPTFNHPIVVLGAGPALNVSGVYASVGGTGTSSQPTIFKVGAANGHPILEGLPSNIDLGGSLILTYADADTMGASTLAVDSSSRTVVAAFEAGVATPYGVVYNRRVQLPFTSLTAPVATNVAKLIDNTLAWVGAKLIVNITNGPNNLFGDSYLYFMAYVEDGNGRLLANYTGDMNMVMYDRFGAPVSYALYTAGQGDYIHEYQMCLNFTSNPFRNATQIVEGSKWWMANFTDGTFLDSFLTYKTGPNMSLAFTLTGCHWPAVQAFTLNNIYIRMSQPLNFNITIPPYNTTLPERPRIRFRLSDSLDNVAICEPMTIQLYYPGYDTAIFSYDITTSCTDGWTNFLVPTTLATNYQMRIFYGEQLVYNSSIYTLTFGVLNIFHFSSNITIGAAGELSHFYIESIDAFNNTVTIPILVEAHSLGTAVTPPLSGTTTLRAGRGSAVFNTVALSAAGCFSLSATSGPNVTWSADTFFYGLPPATVDLTLAENVVVEYTLPDWTDGWEWALLTNTCPGNVSIETAALNAHVLTVTPLDWEAMPTGVCVVEINLAGCPMNHTFTITINNVYEPTETLPQTVDLLQRSPDSFAVGIVKHAELKTHDQLAFQITTMPSVVTLYPDTPTAASAADLIGQPLTAAALPFTITTTGDRITLIYNAGVYNDSFAYTASDGTTSSVPVNITINVNVTCPDPVGMFLSDQGFCVCSAAAFINLDGNCQECPQGTYYSGQQIANPCFACPTGGDCPGGSTPPTAAAGFYCVANAAVPATAYDACVPDAACLGACKCREGHEGDLCGKCVVGYYKDNNLCAVCPSTSALFLSLLAILMVIVCAALIKVARRSTTYFTSLSVGFNFLQVVSILAEFQLQWPPFVLAFLNALSVINFNINLVQPECAFAGGTVPYFPIWIFKLSLPLLFLVIFLAAYWGTRLYAVVRGQINEVQHPWVFRFPKISKSDIIILKNSCINAYFTVLVLLYLNIMSTALEIYSCDDKGRMVKDNTYICHSAAWNGLVAISAVCSLIYGLGIPLTFYGVLRLNRLNLFKELTIIKFGLLYRRYKNELFMWEIVILWRKLGIILGLLFFGSNPVGAAGFALMALALGFIVQLYFQPYVSKRVNYLETIHLTCGSIVLLCGLILAGVTKTGNKNAITTLGVFVILIVCANCCVLFYVVFQELRYQYRLVRRGVQGGFASDEVMVDEFFFNNDFYVREMSRNVMGSTSTIVLSSKTECALRVMYVDQNNKLLDGADKDAKLKSWVQSSGFLHVIVTTFNQPGRYGLRIFARRSTDKEVELLAPPTAVDYANLTIPKRILMGLKNVYRRNDLGTIPTFAYHLNCDVRPRVALSFPKTTEFAKQRGIVLLHPNFFELTPQTQTSFRLTGNPIKVAIAPVRPRTLDEAGVKLMTPPDEAEAESKNLIPAFTGTTTFMKSGPMHLWCQFSLPRASASGDINPTFVASSTVTKTDSRRTSTAASGASMQSFDTFTELGSMSTGKGSGVDFSKLDPNQFSNGPSLGLPAEELDFNDDDHPDLAAVFAGQGKFVRVASFEVLEQHAGWTESGVVESEIMGVLCKNEDSPGENGVEMEVANPVFIEPPTLSTIFTNRRGLLYNPRIKDLTKGKAYSFEVVLPGASVFSLKATKPTSDVDGQLLFKREDNVYNCKATFDTEGPLILWARLATMESNENKLSARPTIGDFLEIVTFNVVK